MHDDLKAYLGSDEKIELETRQHVFIIVDDIVKAVAGLIVLLFVIWLVGEAGFLENSVGEWITYALIAGIVLVVARLLWVFVSWRHERLLVTSSKVVHVHGVLNRDITGTPLVKIDEVTIKQPLFGRMVGYGRLEVQNASGGHEPLHGLKFIPQPAKVYALIVGKAREQRMMEGGGALPPTGMDE